MTSLTKFAVALSICFVALTPARAQDVQLCFSAAELVNMGGKLSETERSEAHQACMRALADSANIVQKYHLQEADFDIMGTRPKQ